MGVCERMFSHLEMKKKTLFTMEKDYLGEKPNVTEAEWGVRRGNELTANVGRGCIDEDFIWLRKNLNGILRTLGAIGKFSVEEKLGLFGDKCHVSFL